MKDYPVIKVTVLFIGGLLLQPLFSFNIIFLLTGLFFLSAVILFSLKSFRNKDLIISLFITMLFISLGAFRASIIHQDHFLSEKIYKLKNFSAYGRITEVQLKREAEIDFFLSADSVQANGRKIGENINLAARIKEEGKKRLDSIYKSISPGNIIMISGTYSKGREKRNPGEFDYNKYLRDEGISGVISAFNSKDFKILKDQKNFFQNGIFQIKKAIFESIYDLHGKETSALLKSLLLADKADIDYETKTDFINTGVIHVLAVSGQNCAFIVLFLLIVFGRLNIYLRSIVSVLGLILFMFLTGVPVSVFRATVMAVIIVTAFIYNRSTNLYNSLALSALIILLVDPKEIYSASFQLSFAAVFSIAAIFPVFNNYIKKFKIRSNVLRYTLLTLAVSLSAQIGTLPFTLYYFGKMSLIALAANLIVIPLIGLITLIAIATLIINILIPYLGTIYAAANDLLTFLLLKIIKYGSHFSFSFVRIRNFSIYDAILFYSLLIFFLLLYKKFKSGTPKFVLLVLVTAIFLSYSALDDKDLFTPNELNLLMIDVGQGDSYLFQMPGGETAIVDAGEASSLFDNGERIIIPLLDHLGIEKIDYGFVSHLDLDHYGGFISLIHEKRIKTIYKPEIDSSDKNDIRFENYLNQNGIRFSYYNKKVLKLHNSRIYFLNNNLKGKYSKNDKSGVIKVVFGKKSFLFTGDAERKREKFLLSEYNSFLKSNLLKVSHHGSPTASSPEFINTVEPEYGFISAGIQNKFRHPAKDVLNRLADVKATIFRSDKSGAVLMRSNGDSLYLVNWRNED